MADVAALSSKVPQSWQRALLPFIQRAAEFEQVKQPVVGYYLLKYVAEEGMDLYKKNPSMKAESTPFISSLLDVLENKKNLYKEKIEELDGRTELSRAALALFTRADDDERRGVVSEAIVKLFYSSSLLFEATKQFMDDKKMDPFATEKHRYAQVVAARMKKSLTNGTPYESPSGAKERVEGVADVDGGSTSDATATDGKGDTGGLSSSTTGHYGYNPSAANPPQAAPSAPTTAYNYVPPPPPPSAPPQTSTYAYVPPTAPPPAPAHAPPPPPQQQPAQQSHPNSAAIPSAAPPKTTFPVNTYVPPSAPPGSYNPTPNDMIDAQKYAKLAVSALQFYDHQNARKQLILALQYLDGQGPK